MARVLKVCLSLFALALAPLQSAFAGPQAVVELFTSQGCSSCRAADALFEELAARPDVVALSFHVDYWDYLGWRDTLADPEHTARQRDYAAALEARRIYTPQIVVNGMLDVVGSDRASVERAIHGSSLPVPVSMVRQDGKVKIEVGERRLPGSSPTTIRLVLFKREATVEIQRGENAGSTMVYRNIVRTVRPIGMWDGSVVRIALPESELMGDGVDGCAVLVQQDVGGAGGPIIGAAQLSRW